MAYDWADAEARMKTIGETLKVDGELFAVITCGAADARPVGIMLQTVANFMNLLRRVRGH
jgi:hypothetical protein